MGWDRMGAGPIAKNEERGGREIVKTVSLFASSKASNSDIMSRASKKRRGN